MIAIYAITSSIGEWTTRLGVKSLLLVVVVVGLRIIDRGRDGSTRKAMEGTNRE
jgi:hypothetical protein